MSIGIAFWVIMILGLIFGLYTNRATPMAWVGSSLIIWVLLALLGWRVFGPAIHN